LNIDPLVVFKKYIPSFKKIPIKNINLSVNNGKEISCTALETFLIESLFVDNA